MVRDRDSVRDRDRDSNRGCDRGRDRDTEIRTWSDGRVGGFRGDWKPIILFIEISVASGFSPYPHFPRKNLRIILSLTDRWLVVRVAPAD